ncbi:MAG: helix-turn-helix domain-containing protein [Sarcina sp.]
MEVGKQIKKYRGEMKISQEQLAEEIFVSRQTISNWENNKNYPDVKSLLLLSSFFNVSLDILIKGDLEKMKENINSEEIKKFKRDSNIFVGLLIALPFLAVPLGKFMGYFGLAIFIFIAIIALYYSFLVEKQKKSFNIQSYKELNAFMEGKTLSEVEKHQEFGKRPYQKVLSVIMVMIGTIIISGVMLVIFS